jgi:hypothetical protein
VWPYLLVFAIPGIIGILDDRRYQAHAAPRAWLFLYGVFVTCFVGLRDNIGADWEQYEYFFVVARFESFEKATQLSDPGYMLLNWCIASTGGNITGVMFFAAAIVGASLVRFSTITPYPWVALAVAASHFTVVMSMSHVRQSIALSFVLLAVVALAERSIARYVLWCVLAAVFHRSAAIFLPIAVLLTERNRAVAAIAICVVASVSYVALLQEAVELYRGRYITSEYAAHGAVFRVAMNVPAAALFLGIIRKHEPDSPLRRFWTIMSICAITLLLFYPLVPSSAAVDRLAKYAMPLQIYVMGWIAIAGGQEIVKRYVARAAVLGCYGMYLYVWLAYSNLASEYWIPYRSVLWGK